MNSKTEPGLILESETDRELELILEFELGAVVGVEGDCGWVVEFVSRRNLEPFLRLFPAVWVLVLSVRACVCMSVCKSVCASVRV